MKLMPMLLAGAFALTTGHLWAASGAEDSLSVCNCLQTRSMP